MLLVCLAFWNSALGAVGGLSMCLHIAGELHLFETKSVDKCCHVDQVNTLDNCNDCDDVNLEGIELLALRDGEITPSQFTAVTDETCAVPEPTFTATDEIQPHSPRGPPYCMQLCLLVAESTVFRV